MPALKHVAIVGSGPMAIYTIKELLKNETPLHLSIFERTDMPGYGMPYQPGMNADYMYCNAFSKEIPAVTRKLATWLNDQDDHVLARYDLEKDEIDNRAFYPRVLIGAFLSDELQTLCAAGRAKGYEIDVLTGYEVSDIVPLSQGFTVQCQSTDGPVDVAAEDVIIATGHSWSAAPKIGSADMVSPWPYTNVTALPPGDIGILGASLSAIDVIVALGCAHGAFHETDDDVTWFPKDDDTDLSVTMVSHMGIMPEPDFFYRYPFDPLHHITADAVSAEIEKGSSGLLDRVFALLIDELDDAAPDYLRGLGRGARTIEGFADAYFAARVETGGLRALRDTLDAAMMSMRDKETQAHRYALLRGHENFELIFDHLEPQDWDRFLDKLMPVFGDCYAAIPHLSVRRILAMYDAGVLRIIPTGPEGAFRNHEDGGVVVETVDGPVRFDALIDARGQSSAAVGALPFPALQAALKDDAQRLKAPYRLDLAQAPERGAVYCLSMPQILQVNPFSQGLVNCHDLGKVVARDIHDSAAPRTS